MRQLVANDGVVVREIHPVVAVVGIVRKVRAGGIEITGAYPIYHAGVRTAVSRDLDLRTPRRGRIRCNTTELRKRRKDAEGQRSLVISVNRPEEIDLLKSLVGSGTAKSLGRIIDRSLIEISKSSAAAVGGV